MTRQWGYRKRDRGQINFSGLSEFFRFFDYASLVGRIAFGTTVGVILWLLKVLVLFRMDTRSATYNSIKEADPDWTVDALISVSYLAIPITIGVLTMLVPSIMVKHMPDMSNTDTRDLNHRDF